MDAVKYFKEKARMGKIDTYGFCTIDCDKCGLSRQNNLKDLGCGYFEVLYPEEAVAVVEKWSEEHKQKTKKQVFYEKFPNAPKDDDGMPQICPDDIWSVDYRKCCGNCVTCWNQPAPEEYQDWSDK